MDDVVEDIYAKDQGISETFSRPLNLFPPPCFRLSAELAAFFPSLVYGVVENKGGEKGSHCVESLVKSQKLRKQGRGKRLKGKKAPNSADNN